MLSSKETQAANGSITPCKSELTGSKICALNENTKALNTNVITTFFNIIKQVLIEDLKILTFYNTASADFNNVIIRHLLMDKSG
jgi:hypothetical protein